MFRHIMIPFRQFPQAFPMVTSILVIQTVVFCMIFFSGMPQDASTWEKFGAMVKWRIDEGEFWRLFFSIFVHDQFLHLLMVAFGMYLFAPQLEWLYGKISFTILYFGSGLIGNWMLYFLDVREIYMGSAECIYGLLGVYLYLYWQRFVYPEVGKAVLFLLVLNMLLDLPLLFVHLTSVVAGFILGWIIMEWKRFMQEEDDEDDL